MRLLFIAPADLGEAVLSTGALASALTRLESAELTIVCEPEAESLFRAAPGLADLRTWPGGSGFRASLRLARGLAGQRFDIALDLGGSGLARIVRAEQKFVARRGVALRQRAGEWRGLLGEYDELAPQLWIDARARSEAALAAGGAGPLLVLAPGADAAGKRWPAERFAAVARRLAGGGGPLSEARILVLGEARDADVTRSVAASLDADGVRARDLSGALDLLSMAALLENATLFIGNDDAPLHLAAAAGAPALGLFGATDERLRSPVGPRVRALRGSDFEATMAILRAPLDDPALMIDLSVDAVEAAALEALRAGGLR